MLLSLCILGCAESQLIDGEIVDLSDGTQCGLPLFTIGMKDGVVCYTGTHVGAIATYHCFDCGFSYQRSFGANQVRTCMLDGTWNGTVPHCDCIDKSKT